MHEDIKTNWKARLKVREAIKSERFLVKMVLDEKVGF